MTAITELLPRAHIRSTLFNIAFMLTSLVCCIAFLPTLLLPRPAHLVFNRAWHYITMALEYGILGLRYEVRGRENLPAGPFLVASKHMSPYETLKLRLILNDPAIILKKELLKIPLWGAYLAKSDVIAIDRSSPELARTSINDGALRMKAQGRPVVIFPQGTRVRPDETPAQKPYKAGIALMQEATGLPIVPLATNSGMFWPAKGWLKSPGKVVFEFLPPIAPGMDKGALMKTLETTIEDRSNALMNEALAARKTKRRFFLKTVLLAFAVVGLALGYFYVWVKTADFYSGLLLKNFGDGCCVMVMRQGFPGPVVLSAANLGGKTEIGDIGFTNFRLVAWPMPILPMTMSADNVVFTHAKHPPGSYLEFENFSARFAMNGLSSIRIFESALHYKNSEGGVSGTLDFSQKPTPKPDLIVTLKNHEDFIDALIEKDLVKKNAGRMASSVFAALADEKGVVHIPVVQKDRTIYAGPVPALILPPEAFRTAPHRRAPDNPPAPVQ